MNTEHTARAAKATAEAALTAALAQADAQASLVSQAREHCIAKREALDEAEQALKRDRAKKDFQISTWLSRDRSGHEPDTGAPSSLTLAHSTAQGALGYAERALDAKVTDHADALAAVRAARENVTIAENSIIDTHKELLATRMIELHAQLDGIGEELIALDPQPFHWPAGLPQRSALVVRALELMTKKDQLNVPLNIIRGQASAPDLGEWLERRRRLIAGEEGTRDTAAA